MLLAAASVHWICTELDCVNGGVGTPCTRYIHNDMLTPIYSTTAYTTKADINTAGAAAVGLTFYCKGTLPLIDDGAEIQCGCPTGMYVDYFTDFANPKCVDVTGCSKSTLVAD